MKIVLATSNLGKVKELQELLAEFEILPLTQVCQPFEIVEDGTSFKENSLIKARAVYAKIAHMKNAIALSDDSGISVKALNGAPGIYSARYGDGSEAGNRAKLAAELSKLGLDESAAFYTACVAVVSPFGEYCSHGFMHGTAIAKERGDKGFGYDSMFIPNGFSLTLAQLGDEIKSKMSHRTKAIDNIKPVLKMLEKRLTLA